MNILLTGSTGMVGSNILEHPDSKLFTVHSPSSNELDLLDKKAIVEFLLKNKIEFIIHCAGLVAGIQFNIKYPYSATITNAYIGLNIIEAARTCSVSRMINLASSCMYPRDKNGYFLESDILGGPLEPTNEGYALAKIIITKVCNYISHEYKNCTYKTIVPCNLYGRYDTFNYHFSHMVPAAIQKIHNAVVKKLDNVEIWGDGNTRREFMLASELADLIWYAVKNFHSLPQVMNAGTGVDYSIKEYYQEIAKILNYKGKFSYNKDAPDGMRKKIVDVKLLNQFGWSSKKTLTDGLREAINFYKDFILLGQEKKMKKNFYIN
jgi:GDP-L-fucose synthase